MTGRPVVGMIGRKFGRLTVQERVPVDSPRRKDQARWRCSCECGSDIVALGFKLRSGEQKSCGCWRRDRTGGLYRTHGKSKTPEYCMFYDARKRAVERGLPFTITPEDIVIPAKCPILGLDLSSVGARDNRPSLDRIRPEEGYVSGNIAVISFRANRIKSDASADELMAIVAYIGAAR